MKNKRVGIPRALLYYGYFPRWKAFFERLGFDVITSASTNEAILKDGLRQSVSDLCLPVKAMLGHICSLKDCVDYLFVPRYVSVERDAYMCPKFIGLPDVVRASFQKLPPVIDPTYNAKEKGAIEAFVSGISKPLSLKKKDVRDAYIRAGGLVTPDTAPPAIEFQGASEQLDGGLRIALVARPYLIEDGYLSKGIARSLRALGAQVVIKAPTREEVGRAMEALPKWIYWSMGRDVVAAAYRHFGDDTVDGVINLSNATCGPDSFTGEMINRLYKGCRKPYMSISIDEHTSAVGMQTRLEAFLDMIKFSGGLKGR